MKQRIWMLSIAACLSAIPLAAQEGGKAGEDIPVSKITTPAPVEITAYDNYIKVANAPVGSVLEIYSVVGVKVREIEMKQPSGQYPVNLAKGYYIIRIGTTVRKIAIR